MSTDSIIDEILAYMTSPEGIAATTAQAQREAKFPKPEVVVPEGLVGQFTAEFEALRAAESPWARDTDGYSEAALVHCLVQAREVALRLTPEACRKLYTEKMHLAHSAMFTPEDGDRLYEIQVQTDGHPISMNLCINMLVCDPRLDTCGYPLAEWLPAYVRGELREWKTEGGGTYGLPWVDAALQAL